jgi:hypothetical protein
MADRVAHLVAANRESPAGQTWTTFGMRQCWRTRGGWCMPESALTRRRGVTISW